MNDLHLESSPYLLQHANNPVHWKAWSQESLKIAKQTNKLIIISIGYSACHWCHVMEHESFEDLDVAKTMNANFINIKVDREERPDVDAVYMKAVQVMTGRGGWPMNVVCLPDGRPVWGGTYFKKRDWINYLEQLQQLKNQEPDKLIQYADKLSIGLNALGIIEKNNETIDFDEKSLALLVQKWQKNFDLEFGGMAQVPKFMMPNNYNFLLRYGYQNNNEQLLNYVNLTLTRMAWGGLFDTIEGGFSRYSVDFKWHVPHFEKMLYDNGQLVSLYANAFKLTKNDLYKTVIEKTLLFVETNFLTNEFGFYSALDADSLNRENHLEEGVFYVWTKDELQLLLKNDYELFSQVFNVNDFGLWENENYVLIQNESLEEIANQNNIEVAFLENKKVNWEKLLLKQRKKRSKPRLDDKCLCSWNALMLNGYIDAYKALQNEHYLKIALQNANFICSNFLTQNGSLNHNYKNGKSTVNGYLEDYSAVIDAFINLYQVTFNESWLHIAKQLTDYCLDNFYDEETNFFKFTSIQDTPLITTHYDIEDNVISSSNSIMANNLLNLGIFYSNLHFEKIAQKMVDHILPNIDYPSAFANWLTVYLNLSDKNKQIAICSIEAINYVKKLNTSYLPDIILAGSTKNSELPFLKNRFLKNENLFYICKNKTCKLPLNSFDLFIESI